MYMDYISPAKQQESVFFIQEKRLEMNTSGVKNTNTKF